MPSAISLPLLIIGSVLCLFGVNILIGLDRCLKWLGFGTDVAGGLVCMCLCVFVCVCVCLCVWGGEVMRCVCFISSCLSMVFYCHTHCRG